MFVYYYLSGQAGIHDSVYALTQEERGLAEVDTTQAPLRAAIRHLSVTYPHFSSRSLEMPCSAPPTTSPRGPK